MQKFIEAIQYVSSFLKTILKHFGPGGQKISCGACLNSCFYNRCHVKLSDTAFSAYYRTYTYSQRHINLPVSTFLILT